MVKASIKVRNNGATRLEVGVQAESIRRVLSIVAKWYLASDVRVKVYLNPEVFLVKER
ncbi:MAG: hypothetical protein AVDCRST_MAG28-4171 [uncultured Rubrobacteraceae bacterium]|uniref:Uncharacterized protein n=1 Tax=uncultured Rubrobacteraceae bacterium TaxID=349277 RepID=A0A6J4R808_9ACTN|nr:MAG: hypothetical protein AVDCRST_MAG28-4171 [uncultured Rubrobacteraceae bacterium]